MQTVSFKQTQTWHCEMLVKMQAYHGWLSDKDALQEGEVDRLGPVNCLGSVKPATNKTYTWLQGHDTIIPIYYKL